MSAYLPLVIFMAISFGIAAALLLLAWLRGTRRPNKAKLSAYECGFEPFGDTRIPFDIRFYLIALLFIVFDLEVAFFFPWALSLREIGWGGFLSMMGFIGILGLGFLYEWRKGALEWE